MHTVSPVVASELSFVEGPPGGPPRGVSGDSGGSKAEGSNLKKKKILPLGPSDLGVMTWLQSRHL